MIGVFMFDAENVSERDEDTTRLYLESPNAWFIQYVDSNLKNWTFHIKIANVMCTITTVTGISQGAALSKTQTKTPKPKTVLFVLDLPWITGVEAIHNNGLW